MTTLRSIAGRVCASASEALAVFGKIDRRERERVMQALALLLATLFTFCVLAPLPSRAAAPVPRDNDVKAAFLFNFASFVEWPESSFASPTAPFIIGVLGDYPFGHVLDDILRGEQIKGHPLAVRRLSSKQLSEATACQILFISASEARRLRPLLQTLRGKPVLTVSDAPNFIESGGAIAFSTDSSVRLSINPLGVRDAHLNVSSKLLRLAQVVERDPSAP